MHKGKKKILGSSSNPDCKKESTIKKELDLYASQGTSFFISNNGYMVTNYHIIDKCDDNVKIKYKTKDYDVRVVAKDRILDLALLEAKNVGRTKYLSLSSDPPEKLQKIIAVGYPFGKWISDDLKFTSGIISSIKGLMMIALEFKLMHLLIRKQWWPNSLMMIMEKLWE